MIKSLRNQEGFALVTVFVLIWALFSLSLSYLQITIGQKKNHEKATRIVVAEAIAEAALEDVLWEYNFGGANFDSASGWVTSGSDATKSVASFTDTSSGAIGSYQIIITGYNSSNPAVEISASTNDATNAGTAALSALLTDRPLFSRAINTGGLVTLNGYSMIDAYDSSAGAYGGPNVTTDAFVASSLVSSEALAIANTATIHGYVSIPRSSTVSDPTRIIQGVTYDNTASQGSVSVPSSLIALSSSGALNSTATLSAGAYKYNNITLSSGQVISVTGDVVLYLTDPTQSIDMQGTSAIQISSGSLTIYADGQVDLQNDAQIGDVTSHQAQKAVLYNTSSSSINLNNNSVFVGAIQAPNATVNLAGNSILYGAASAYQMSLSNNAALHWDKHLKTLGPTQGYQLQWYRRT